MHFGFRVFMVIVKASVGVHIISYIFDDHTIDAIIVFIVAIEPQKALAVLNY